MKTEIGYRKKVKRMDVPGQAHYLTFSCFRNQPFLNKDRARIWFIEALGKAKEKHNFELWAWVIMPEHVHLMVLPGEETKVSNLLKSIKLSVAKTASLWVKDNAPGFLSSMTDTQPDGTKTIRFWQRGGGYDRNICSVDELYEKINYIHKNPVRRGLVDHPGDWHWSSYRAFEERVGDPISVDFESLPPMRTEIKHA